MAEFITRRFRRWARYKEDGGDMNKLSSNESSVLDKDNLNDWPDLVVIDGGKGQLSSVLEALEELNLDQNINLISFSIFSGDIVGQIFTMLILTVAAAEAAIGLAIIVIYYRNKGSIRVEDIHGMKG